MPWYVAYGHVIGWSLIVAIALLPLALVRWKRARADRALARLDRIRFEAGQGAPAEGQITVRGLLRGGRARTVSTAGTQQHSRDQPLWVEHEGERLDLEGDVRVVRGSRVRATWRSRSHEVVDGDAVIVTGTASRSASSYREQAWKLQAIASGWPIELCADPPASRGRPLAPWWLAATLVMFGAGGFLGLRAFGESQLEAFPMSAMPEQRPELRWTNPAVLASMIPPTRERGLAYLYLQHRQLFARSQDSLDARVELAEMLEGRMRWIVSPQDTPPERYPTACEAAAGELLEQARFEQALARGCASERLKPSVFRDLGRYAEIGDPKPDWMNAAPDIARGRWSAAAAEFDTSTGRCVGLMLEALGGSAAARVELDNAGVTDVECAIERAFIAPVGERARLLSGIRIDTEAHISTDYVEALVADLRWAYDPAYEGDEPTRPDDVVAFAEGGAVGDDHRRELLKDSILRRTWLSHEAHDDAPHVHLYRALFALERGDFTTARAEQVLSGREDLAEVIASREGAASVGIAGTDGRVVAAKWVRSFADWDARRLLREASAVTAHREALHTPARVLVADSELRWITGTKRWVHEAALIRDVHRAVGDPAQVARWQAIIDRHVAAFAEPEKRRAIAFLHD